MRAVLVVELDLPDDDDPEVLAETTRRVTEHLQGMPVHRVWAGIREVADAVAALHEQHGVPANG